MPARRIPQPTPFTANDLERIFYWYNALEPKKQSDVRVALKVDHHKRYLLALSSRK